MNNDYDFKLPDLQHSRCPRGTCHLTPTCASSSRCRHAQTVHIPTACSKKVKKSPQPSATHVFRQQFYDMTWVTVVGAAMLVQPNVFRWRVFSWNARHPGDSTLFRFFDHWLRMQEWKCCLLAAWHAVMARSVRLGTCKRRVSIEWV